jgi:hypothetical protein
MFNHIMDYEYKKNFIEKNKKKFDKFFSENKQIKIRD